MRPCWGLCTKCAPGVSDAYSGHDAAVNAPCRGGLGCTCVAFRCRVYFLCSCDVDAVCWDAARSVSTASTTDGRSRACCTANEIASCCAIPTYSVRLCVAARGTNGQDGLGSSDIMWQVPPVAHPTARFGERGLPCCFHVAEFGQLVVNSATSCTAHGMWGSVATPSHRTLRLKCNGALSAFELEAATLQRFWMLVPFHTHLFRRDQVEGRRSNGTLRSCCASKDGVFRPAGCSRRLWGRRNSAILPID
jgi:hypothetical protein